MRYYTSKETTDTLIDYINDNYQTYLDDIAIASGVTLKKLTSVEIGGPAFQDKVRRKPYMLIEPVSEEIDDQIAGQIETTLRYDVLVEASGYQEADALTLVGLYKDAFISMILSDDTLGGAVEHARVRNVEQFPGGSGTSKYILMAVEITVDAWR